MIYLHFDSEVIVDERITDDNSVNGDNSSSFGVFMIKLTYANRDLKKYRGEVYAGKKEKNDNTQ